MLRLFVLIALLHGYIAWRLIPDLPGGAASMFVMGALLALSAAALPCAEYARRHKHNPWADHLAAVGFIAMGFFSSLLILTLGRDVMLLAASAASGFLINASAVESLHAWSAPAVPLSAVLVTLIGFINARRRAAIRAIDVLIHGLPAALQGFRIVQLTDIHVGATIKRDYVSRIVDAVNALDADVIAITGDLVDGSVARLSAHTEPLGRLAARHGVFFVTGNHEYYSGVHGWVVELRRLGLSVLLNEHVVLDHRGAALVIAGVTDLSAHHFDASHRSDPVAAIAGAPPQAVKVLLAHQPRSAVVAAQAGYHLQLSGHTHGGQFFPWSLVVKLFEPYSNGLYRLGELSLYVSRGTGYWGPPKRFGAPSEITHLRLMPA